MRVLRYIRHGVLPCPFIVLEHEPGVAEIIWPSELKKRGHVRGRLYIDLNDHSGRHEYPPEEWSDEICVAMAMHALGIKGKRKRRRK